MNILKKSKLLAASTLAMTLTSQSLSAQGAALKPSEKVVSGYIIKEGAYQNVYIYGSTARNLYYKSNLKNVNTVEKSLTAFDSIYLFEPEQFRIAKSLYRDRKYEEAATQFLKTRKLYKDFKHFENNFQDLSTYYLLECYRKLKKFDELKKELELFDFTKLTRPSQLEQLATYKFWIAAHGKDWNRLRILTKDWYSKVEAQEAKPGYNAKKPSISVRAQIAFCQGLAYEGLGYTKDALNSYAKAMTADFTKSDIIVREAALNSLRIYAKDPEIATAIKLWESEYEKEDSGGYIALGQANALARIYVKAGLGAGKPLPAEYEKFLKHTSKKMIELLKQREEEKANGGKPVEKEEPKEEKKPKEEAKKATKKVKTVKKAPKKAPK